MQESSGWKKQVESLTFYSGSGTTRTAAPLSDAGNGVINHENISWARTWLAMPAWSGEVMQKDAARCCSGVLWLEVISVHLHVC